ncbi:hypothetical protein CO2235_U700004 [Cupriavidus oxalaticus]|uniref:Uncharacterized protein n=1 Tax=Cupriavidus oxalaticus TaxID=96344 RepID=A0A375FRA5_9BURK|nr:hypothetical protein CO2235_U700004 [Cupriavidus oxalaticus]
MAGEVRHVDILAAAIRAADTGQRRSVFTDERDLAHGGLLFAATPANAGRPGQALASAARVPVREPGACAAEWDETLRMVAG